jgi:hypothetical protein
LKFVLNNYRKKNQFLYFQSKGDYVLPALYVLDSMVKNLRSTTYIKLFENKLPVIFASAFNKVSKEKKNILVLNKFLFYRLMNVLV